MVRAGASRAGHFALFGPVQLPARLRGHARRIGCCARRSARPGSTPLPETARILSAPSPTAKNLRQDCPPCIASAVVIGTPADPETLIHRGHIGRSTLGLAFRPRSQATRRDNSTQPGTRSRRRLQVMPPRFMVRRRRRPLCYTYELIKIYCPESRNGR
jgi:hypothetical protein